MLNGSVVLRDNLSRMLIQCARFLFFVRLFAYDLVFGVRFNVVLASFDRRLCRDTRSLPLYKKLDQNYLGEPYSYTRCDSIYR